MSTSARQPVVVVLGDGSRRKGIIDGFHPTRVRLRMQEVDLGGNMLEIHDLDMHDILAIFFVRDLAVHRTHRFVNRASPSPERPDSAGLRLRIKFVWGEVFEGVLYDQPQGRWGGLTVYPVSAVGRAYNILRAYVTRAAIVRIDVIEARGASRRVASL